MIEHEYYYWIFKNFYTQKMLQKLRKETLSQDIWKKMREILVYRAAGILM